MLDFMKFAVFSSARAIKCGSGVIRLEKRLFSLLSKVIQRDKISLQLTTLLVSN